VRDAFRDGMTALARGGVPFVFLTGDLGFGALEPLRDALGPRFINAGISEQNLVSVAAGLAADGTDAWAYSIAPFLYARALEQVRNDVCFHGLPVRLVGNGGGFSYGSMGPTHHALEDYGILTALKGMRAYVPAFNEDLAAVLAALTARRGPAYLRLGRGEAPKGVPMPDYAPWRRLVSGDGPTLAVVGPLAGTLWSASLNLPQNRRPRLWVCAELPLADTLPEAFLEDVESSGTLALVEEHVAQGGAGPALAAELLQRGRAPRIFRHFAVRGYPSGRVGSQAFHRRENGLDAPSVLAALGCLP